MEVSSIVAIYFLFFAFSAFILLPFGVKTDEEAGTPKIPGQAESAPHRFDLRRHLLKAAILAFQPTLFLKEAHQFARGTAVGLRGALALQHGRVGRQGTDSIEE